MPKKRYTFALLTHRDVEILCELLNGLRGARREARRRRRSRPRPPAIAAERSSNW